MRLFEFVQSLLTGWWGWLVALLVLLGLQGGCAKLLSSESVKQFDSTLETLNRHGVIYSGTLEGPVEGSAEAYQGVRAGTGGWFSLRLQSPVANPMAPNAPANPGGVPP